MTRTSRFLLSTTVLDSSSTATVSAVAEPPEEPVSVESDFVVILAALLCALICVLGLIMVARCAWLRRAGSTASTATTRTSNHSSAAANKGIKKKFIEAIPKFTYDSSIGEGKPLDVDCAICLAEYADGDEIRVLPQCGHRFHVGCIDTWLGSHSSCPSCREILVITRCRKCGEFPTVSAGELTELKGRHTAATTSSSSNEFLP